VLSPDILFIRSARGGFICIALQCWVWNLYLYGQIGFLDVALQYWVWNFYLYGNIWFPCVVLQCWVWNLYLYGKIGCPRVVLQCWVWNIYLYSPAIRRCRMLSISIHVKSLEWPSWMYLRSVACRVFKICSMEHSMVFQIKLSKSKIATFVGGITTEEECLRDIICRIYSFIF